MPLRIKDWNKFQHFKDRKPPWIKLYRDILDDPDWHELDGDTAKMLVSIWLIASEDETQQGYLPDTRRLAFRLRISESKLKQSLTKLSHWLYQDDIKVISDCYQVDIPETETETEKERERETKKEKETDSATALLANFGITGQLSKDFVKNRKSKNAPITETALNRMKTQADKAGLLMSEAVEVCIERNWQGFNAEWYGEKPKQTQKQLITEADINRSARPGETRDQVFKRLQAAMDR